MRGCVSDSENGDRFVVSTGRMRKAVCGKKGVGLEVVYCGVYLKGDLRGTFPYRRACSENVIVMTSFICPCGVVVGVASLCNVTANLLTVPIPSVFVLCGVDGEVHVVSVLVLSLRCSLVRGSFFVFLCRRDRMSPAPAIR